MKVPSRLVASGDHPLPRATIVYRIVARRATAAQAKTYDEYHQSDFEKYITDIEERGKVLDSIYEVIQKSNSLAIKNSLGRHYLYIRDARNAIQQVAQ